MKKAFFTLLFLSLIPVYGHSVTADDNYHSGLTAYQAGKWGEAISYLEGATQLNPNYWEAFQLLGYSYYRINDTPNCIQNCESSLKIHPNNPTLQAFLDKLKTRNLPAPSVDNLQNNFPNSVPSKAIFQSASVNPNPYNNPNQSTITTNKGFKPGFGIAIGGGYSTVSFTDWNNEISNELAHPTTLSGTYDLTSSGGTVSDGFNIDLDLRYKFSPMFMAGLDIEYLDAPSELSVELSQTNGSGTYDLTEDTTLTFSTIYVGPSVYFCIPDSIFRIGGGIGYFTLFNASSNFSKDLATTGSYGAQDITTNGINNLAGSSIAGKVSLGMDCFLDSKMSIGVDIGYRFATITQVTSNGSPLKKLDGTDVALDFSGVFSILSVGFWP